MSILIPGMEMPTCCYECPCISTADIGVGTAYGCSVLPAFMYDPSKRLEDCPLIELPPHGRLIDADALIDEAYQPGAYGYVDAIQIENAPTIIPAEGGADG